MSERPAPGNNDTNNDPPSSPREAFSAKSRSRRAPEKLGGQPESVLESKAAEVAAEPWMEVAEKLYAAKEEMETGWVYSDPKQKGPMNDLTDYAEGRAHRAAQAYEAGEADRGNVLTETEKVVLSVYDAEAEMIEAEVEMDDITAEQIEAVRVSAQAKAAAAREAGKHEERRKWESVTRRAYEFDKLMFGGLDEDERDELGKQLKPHAGIAAHMVLRGLDENGNRTPGDQVTLDYYNDAKRHAKDLRKTLDFYDELAEVRAKEPFAEPEAPSGERQPGIDQEKLRRRVAERNFNKAKAKVDPEYLKIGDISDIRGRVRDRLRQARSDVATAQESGDAREMRNAKARGVHWQLINRGMNQYEQAFLEDRLGNPEDLDYPNVLAEDTEELEQWNAFMKAWAAENPAESAEASASEGAASEKAQTTRPEYDPKEKVLPENPKEWAEFARNYYADDAHNEFTEENVKVLQHFIVEQARQQLGYIARNFQGSRADGGISMAFGPTAFTMEYLKTHNHDQRFAWKLAAHNLGQPDLKFGEFISMSLKDIARATGVDITEQIPDYDERVNFRQRPPVDMAEDMRMR